MVEGRLSRLATETLLSNPNAEGRLSRLAVEVLIREEVEEGEAINLAADTSLPFADSGTTP